MQALLEKTVGELVVEKPGRAQVFESLGIDFCCGGRRKLNTVCSEKGLDPAVVERVLTLFDNRSNENTEERDWSSAGLTELADHIQQTHHAYLKRDLPQLGAWVDKVAQRHGTDDPRLAQVATVFAGLSAEMFLHMQKEEAILFPLIRAMEAGKQPARSHCGSIQNPIRVMFAEHEDAGNALEQMWTLTDGFTPPAQACNTYRAMLDGLAELRRDMHQHVHKENNILFPRAIELEHQLCPA